MVVYENFKVRNEAYDADYWQKINVLYSGAKTLKDVLERGSKLREGLFPRHLGEEDWVYEERCKRACYVPHLTQLVDYVLSVLFSDSLEMTAGGDDEDTKPGSIEPFYDDFFRNTARPGSKPVTFNQLIRVLAQDALLFKRAWCLVDFPKAPIGDDGAPVKPANAYEEQAMSLDRAYCCPLAPEAVIDWETDEEDGELLWAAIASSSRKRASVEQKRNVVKEVYTVYDREGWTRYVWEFPVEKPPEDKSPPTSVEQGKHSFGQVPVLFVELPDGLWAGGKLENIAVELFNKRSAISWGQYRSLFQILVAKLQGPDPLNPISEDGNRAITQNVGPGRVVQLAEKDSFGFVGPDAAPFAEARADMRELVEEMHRVLHQMAQATPNSGAALGRSAQSKQIDQSHGAVVSKELGRIFRDFAVELCDMVSDGRMEEEKEWAAKGLEDFDDVSLTDFVTEAATLETVPIPSQTFQVLYKYEVASKILPGATDEQLDKIYAELEKNITAESFAPMDMNKDPSTEPYDPKDPDGDGDDDTSDDPKKNPDVEEDKKAGNTPEKVKTAAKGEKA